jgi:antitoxin (DNA-binding transcriptional repressor) of toxin-antitoxin stability system
LAVKGNDSEGAALSAPWRSIGTVAATERSPPKSKEFGAARLTANREMRPREAARLTPGVPRDTLSSVKTISIKQLHAETGKWVRAARKGPVIVTDRGEKVASLQAHVPADPPRPVFAGRDWSKLPKLAGDSTGLISADRNGR